MNEAKAEFLSQLKLGYVNQYNAVQPIPYIRDRWFCVDSVFVEGGIEYFIVDERTRVCERWGKLNSYKDIFHDVNIKSVRRILEGGPGFGKSTLTLQVAYDWCNGIAGSVSEKYEILILLRLKQLGGVKSIFRAIKRFVLPRDSNLSETDIEEILKESKSVLVILDGFDEYPEQDDDGTSDVWKIIKMDMFQMFDVIVTTQTARLPTYFAPHTKRIRLTGFDKRAQDEYIRKAVTGNDEAAVMTIKRRLLENSVLDDLCQVPLFFVMFAHISHESEHLKQFKSVTSFFSYMIKCFHHHLKNKIRGENVEKYDSFEEDHSELDRIAFEGLCKENQQLIWGKDELCKRLGKDFYHQYVSLGILVEEDVLDMKSSYASMVVSNLIQVKTEVRFCHKLFCQWYAAHYLASYAGRRNVRFMGPYGNFGKLYHKSLGRKDISSILKNLDPFDCQYVLRFACGLNSNASGKIIEHLKNTKHAHHFSVLCILETEGENESILHLVRDLCSSMVKISIEDTLLLQRSTIQLLEIATSSKISISCLYLRNLYSTVDLRGDRLQLKSNLSIPVLASLKKLWIDEDGKEITSEEFADILEYSSKSLALKELRFHGCRLPPSGQVESVSDLISRKVKVLWSPRYSVLYRLNLQSCLWEEHENTLDELQDEQVHVTKQAQEQITDLKEERVLDETKTDYADKIELLIKELNETKQTLLTRTKELQTTSKGLELSKQVLKETEKERDNTRTELKRCQLDFAKESKALKEVLLQTKDAMAELHKRLMEDKPSANVEETRDEGGAILAAKFGRLIVDIAERLTLDNCLRLASLCNISASDWDTVLRVSSKESPGMKLLDVLKIQKVLNMFDVTKLQKALTILNLEEVNHDIVVPYQEKIDKEQYELYKVKDTYTWEVKVNAAKDFSAQGQIRDGQTPSRDETEPEYSSQTKVAAQHSGTEDKEEGPFLGGRHHELYSEKSIGREGGTIHLANVSLAVPPGALLESRVIALSIMCESPFPLDREVDTARMTPLIKLEPLDLEFKKYVQLNIPHCALISDPVHHDVIIYTGKTSQNNANSSDFIKWTKDISIPRQLKEKSVTVDIRCLTYLSASLVSQTSPQRWYIVRIVPFFDVIRNTDDDIIVTVCFCSDNDAAYKMLLSDYKTKLPLEQYSTIQLCPKTRRDGDDAEFLSVTFTSCNNTYVPDAVQAVKRFPISHLCTASRVSHQLRLQKNKDIDRDDVQVSLTFSQAESTLTEIFMESRIKDLMISQESECLLIGSMSSDLKPYEKLKASISSMLEKDDCDKLAACFDLDPAEGEKVTMDASPGRMLMKILDKREMIMPQKMLGLYEGLKVCHLDKIARLVLEYITKNSNETHHEKQNNEEDKCAKEIPDNASVPQRPRQNRRSGIDKSVQTTVTATSSSSDSVLKMLNQELLPDENETSDTLNATHRSYIILKWIKNHLGIMRCMLPMLVDGILQSQGGVLTLYREFKN